MFYWLCVYQAVAWDNDDDLSRPKSDRSVHVENKSIHVGVPPKYSVMRDLWNYWSRAIWSLNSAPILQHLAGIAWFIIWLHGAESFMKAVSRAAREEIPRLLKNPQFHNHAHKRLLLFPNLGQKNPVHIRKPHIFKIRCNIFSFYIPRFPKESLSLSFRPTFFIHTSYFPRSA
jgi:hypothetical protein